MFYILHRHLFAVFLRPDARNPESGTERRGPGCATVQNGRGKSDRRPFFKGVAVQARCRAKLMRSRFLRERRARFEAQAAADAEALSQANQSATRIQSRFRGSRGRQSALARSAALREQEMEAAALRIQCSVRGRNGRRDGETQRDYVRRVQRLTLKAARMWTQRSLGYAWDRWHAFAEVVQALRKRCVQRMTSSLCAAAFDAWILGTEETKQTRFETVRGCFDELVVPRLEERDPQERFRRGMVALSVPGEDIEDHLAAFVAFRRTIEHCDTMTRDSRMLHWLLWTAETERQRNTMSMPAPPECCVSGREKQGGGLLDKLRSSKGSGPQVARAMLVKTTATRAIGKGPRALVVTVEPICSLNVPACSGERVRCEMSVDDGSAQDPGTPARNVVWSEPRTGPSDDPALGWEGEGCAATLDIDDSDKQKVLCVLSDRTQFAVGLKTLPGQLQDAEVCSTHEWMIVKPAPARLLLRVEHSGSALRVAVERAEGLPAGASGWDQPDPYALTTLVSGDWRGRTACKPQGRKTSHMKDTLVSLSRPLSCSHGPRLVTF